MREQKFEDVLSDLELIDPTRRNSVNSGATLTIWLPADYKAIYDKLQKLTGRRMSRKVREVVQSLLKAAEAKAL